MRHSDRMSASQSDSPVPQPGLDAVAPPISHEIYGMPAFVSFAVRDVVATRSWYTEGLDFVDLFSFPAPDSTRCSSISDAGNSRDILIRHAEKPPLPGTSATLSIAAVYSELEALTDRARRHGGGTVEDPVDSPWNTTDLLTPTPTATPLCSPRRPPRTGSMRRSRHGSASCTPSRTASARRRAGPPTVPQAHRHQTPGAPHPISGR